MKNMTARKKRHQTVSKSKKQNIYMYVLGTTYYYDE